MCEYVQVPCVHSRCGELVTRSNLVEHLEKSCQFRMEKCDHCQTLFGFGFLEVRINLLKSVFTLKLSSFATGSLSNLILNVLLHLTLQQ